MPRYYYRKEIKRSIRKHSTIPEIGKMLRDTVGLVADEFGVDDYICVLT